MNTITMRMLRDFIGSARGQSQSEILKSFLRWVVFKSGLSESGIHHDLGSGRRQAAPLQ